jgi:hypothetical protein
MNPRAYQSFPYRLPLSGSPVPPKWFIKNMGQRDVRDCRRYSWSKIDVTGLPTVLVDGDTLTIPVWGYPGGALVFEVDATGTNVPAVGHVELSVVGLVTIQELCTRVVDDLQSTLVDLLGRRYCIVEQPTATMIYVSSCDGGARADRDLATTAPTVFDLLDYSTMGATIHPRMARFGAGRRFRELHDPAFWIGQVV